MPNETYYQHHSGTGHNIGKVVKNYYLGSGRLTEITPEIADSISDHFEILKSVSVIFRNKRNGEKLGHDLRNILLQRGFQTVKLMGSDTHVYFDKPVTIGHDGIKFTDCSGGIMEFGEGQTVFIETEL